MKRVLFIAGIAMVMLTASAPSALAGGRFYIGFGIGFGTGYHCYRPYTPYYGYYRTFYRAAIYAPRVVRVPYYYRYRRPAYRVVTVVPRSLPAQKTTIRQTRPATAKAERTYGQYLPRRYVKRR